MSYSAVIRGDMPQRLETSPDAYMDNYYRYWQRLVYNKEKPLLFNQKVVNQLSQHGY